MFYLVHFKLEQKCRLNFLWKWVSSISDFLIFKFLTILGKSLGHFIHLKIIHYLFGNSTVICFHFTEMSLLRLKYLLKEKVPLPETCHKRMKFLNSNLIWSILFYLNPDFRLYKLHFKVSLLRLQRIDSSLI